MSPLKIARRSRLGTAPRSQVNPPASFISRAPWRNAASASRDREPPTLMRLTPASASSATVIDGSSVLATTLTGRVTDATTVRIDPRSRSPGAYSTSAPTRSNACSRRIVSSRSTRPWRRFSARAVSVKGIGSALATSTAACTRSTAASKS